MKWIVFAIVGLLLLVSCAKEELPPSPPPPGGESVVGKAMGGVPISPSVLPKWAAAPKYIDVTPTSVKIGDTIVMTVEKPAGMKNKFYAYAEAYVFNKKFRIWERVLADVSKSGKITQKWAEDKAVFYIPVTAERGFESGADYAVAHWRNDIRDANDKVVRDSQGYVKWNDEDGWYLLAFEFLGVGGLSEFLIEHDLTNNRWKGSVKGTPPGDAFIGGSTKSSGTMGDAYTATYINLGNVKSEVTVIKLIDVPKFKQDLAKELANLDPRWTTRGGATCGFLFPSSGVVSFSWLANNYWVTVKTYANSLEDDKVGNYAKKSPPDKYPSDCNLLNELKTIAATLGGVCGNGVKETNEQCDKADDSACPGTCKPDCACTMKVSTAGVCGDCVINPGEQCEPPEKKDTLGLTVMSGSPCWVKDGAGTIITDGHCNQTCQCLSGKVVFPQCGNGKCDTTETAQSCPVDCCGQAVQPAPAPVSCSDTDDVNYFVKGSVTTGTPSISVDDSCFDASTLKEQTCAGVMTVTCTWGCTVGKCDPKPSPTSCPDALAVWSRDYKGSDLRDIWYSAYWDVGNWAAPTGAVKTGEAASLAVLANDDNDADIATWPAPPCGAAIVVWSNMPPASASADASLFSSSKALAASLTVSAASAKLSTPPKVYYSIWTLSGWSIPAVVAVNGYDPAVDVDVFGKAVAVFTRSDGLWSSVLTGTTWSAPVKVYDATDVSIPQITWNPISNKWIAVWITGTKAKYAVFDPVASSWSTAADVPGQSGVTAVGGSAILPSTRLHVNSQWFGIKNAASVYVEAGTKTLIADLTLPPPGTSIIVDSIYSPHVKYDFLSDKWHVVGKGNSKERYVDEGSTAAADAADTGFVDGRPSDTYIRISNADIMVWHSEDESSPYYPDIYWSRRDPTTGLWSPAMRLVTLGLANHDRNADIAPLYVFTDQGHQYFDQPVRTPPPNWPPWEPFNPTRTPPDTPSVGPPGGDGDGNGDGGGHGGGDGGSGGGIGAGGNVWVKLTTCTPPNCPQSSAGCPLTMPAVGTPCPASMTCVYGGTIFVCANGQVAIQQYCLAHGISQCNPDVIGPLIVGGSSILTTPLASDTATIESTSSVGSDTLWSSTGQAIRIDVPEQSSSNLALVLFTAFGILFITLINFVHHEE